MEKLQPSLIMEKLQQNTDKYTSKSNDLYEYRFGIEHQHPHLKPIHASIYDELLNNKYYPIADKLCKTSLVKAIKLHAVAKGPNYANELTKCENG